MENKSEETKQQLEPWTPPTETFKAYQDLEFEIVNEGGPIIKIMVYTRRYPSILIFWVFLTLVALALCGIKDVFVYKGILVLGGVGYIGSTLRRRNDDKQK